MHYCCCNDISYGFLKRVVPPNADNTRSLLGDVIMPHVLWVHGWTFQRASWSPLPGARWQPYMPQSTQTKGDKWSSLSPINQELWATKILFFLCSTLENWAEDGDGGRTHFQMPRPTKPGKKKPGRGDPSTRLCYPGNMAQYSTNLFYQPQMPQVRGKWETRSQQKKGGRREKTITCANHQPLKLLKVTCKPGQGQASDPAIALLCPVVDATVKGKEAADVGAACCYCC